MLTVLFIGTLKKGGVLQSLWNIPAKAPKKPLEPLEPLEPLKPLKPLKPLNPKPVLTLKPEAQQAWPRKEYLKRNRSTIQLPRKQDLKGFRVRVGLSTLPYLPRTSRVHQGGPSFLGFAFENEAINVGYPKGLTGTRCGEDGDSRKAKVCSFAF